MKRTTLILTFPALLALGCGLNGGGPDGSGTIECTQVDLAPQVSGRILEITADEGDVVAAGDTLVRMDPQDYRLRADEAGAGLALEQARLDLALAGARSEDIKRAREQVRQAEAAERAAASDLARVREVFEKGSATGKQMDDAKAHFDEAKAGLEAARQSLEKLLRGTRQEEIRMAQAGVDLARARLAQADKALADCTVAAPLAGIVTTKIREAGETVSTGAPILTITRMEEAWLSVYIPETRLSKVKLGQRAFVAADGDPKRYEGTVTYVSPEAEFTPRNVQTPEERAKLVYRVKITLPNPDGVFKPGMPADGYLEGSL